MAAKAQAKAEEAQVKAMAAHMNAEEYQQWAEEMQAWKKEMEQWKNSDEWKQWQDDVQKWSKEYGEKLGKAYGGDGNVSVPPMPPMPAMPAPPAPVAPHPMPMPMAEVHVPAMPEIHAPALPDIEVSAVPHVNVQSNVNVDARHDDGKVKATETMNFTSPMVDGGLLIVENRVGAVKVHGAATDECRVEIKVTARAETEEEAQAMARAVKMKVDTSDTRFFIKPIKPDNDEWSGIDVTFEITVPHHVNLQIASDVGAVLLRDVQGQIKVKSNVGEVKTENVRGDIELETNVGNVDFIVPDDPSAKVSAVTNMGSIRSDFGIQIVSTNMAGQGKMHVPTGKTATCTLGAGEGTVKLKSNIGSISIRSKDSCTSPPGSRRCPHHTPRRLWSRLATLPPSV